jgi:AraC-like DNA-binding protein
MMRAFETRHPASGLIGPHRHEAPYVAIVLEGGYEEFSLDGAWLCEPGDWVVHPRWHFHANRFAARRCRVLNLVLPVPLPPGVWRRRHTPLPGPSVRPDALADWLSDIAPKPPRKVPDSVASFVSLLREPGRTSVSEAAARVGWSREHASRLHRRCLGLSPRAMRLEEQIRHALELITETSIPLAEVAVEAGFADQAHLTRRIREATGRTPGTLRRDAQITIVQ